MENGWFAGDEMVMGEELRIEVHPVSGGSRSIDIKLKWTPARLPVNPDYPPTWMTRHYGVLAVGWPGVKAETIPAGKSVSCRYRIWIHRGTPEVPEIQSAYDEYLKGLSNR